MNANNESKPTEDNEQGDHQPITQFAGLPNVNADPIDYLCRCFSYDAREAVEVAMFDPAIPLQDLTGRRFLYDYPGGKRSDRPHRMLWLFNALAEQLRINAADTADRTDETSELLCAFATFAQYYAFRYLTARHPQNADFAAALVAVQKTYCQDGLLLKLSVSPDEFARRLRTLLDLDAATKPTAQAADGAKVAAERAADIAAETHSILKAHLTPRPADYQVSQYQLSEMLRARNCPKTTKTIQRWEKYLQTDGKGANATKPPDGYTLQTRLTLQTAMAWVDSYASKDNAKLQTKISFEARFGGRS